MSLKENILEGYDPNRVVNSLTKWAEPLSENIESKRIKRIEKVAPINSKKQADEDDRIYYDKKIISLSEWYWGIVDLLDRYWIDSSQKNRKKIAKHLEMDNYDFSARKNSEMLWIINDINFDWWILWGFKWSENYIDDKNKIFTKDINNARAWTKYWMTSNKHKIKEEDTNWGFSM